MEFKSNYSRFWSKCYHAVAIILALSEIHDQAEMLYFNMKEDRFELQMKFNGQSLQIRTSSGL
jgi:hypothetical protein